jgi:predicted small secreted protein
MEEVYPVAGTILDRHYLMLTPSAWRGVVKRHAKENGLMTLACVGAPSVAHRRLLCFLASLACVAVASAALAACSTTEGFGRDVKNLGGGIENSAAKNK